MARAGDGRRKPLLAAWMGGPSVAEGLAVFEQAGVPAYNYPEQAVEAFMHLVAYARNLETLHETPRALPVSFALDRARVKDLMATILSEGARCSPRLRPRRCSTHTRSRSRSRCRPRRAEDAVAAAERIGYPVVLKVRSPDVTHKTDVGGVAVGVDTPEEVAAAYERILTSVAERQPERQVRGVTVQPMVPRPATSFCSGPARTRASAR